MPVYVDAAIWPLGRMMMCHMLADTLGELHAMADTIGVSRRHFQWKPGKTPHYDICKSKRALAVKAGAIECDRHAIAAISKRLRENPPADFSVAAHLEPTATAKTREAIAALSIAAYAAAVRGELPPEE